MKKKVLLLLLLCCFLLVGCGKKSEKNIVSDISKKINKINSYQVSGKMEIINNEDTYEYDVEVSYKKDNFYKVKLINLLNNHEQIILRNKDGVYVITPSLNKSFKFQSEWPYNNSQIYLLKSISDDIKNDSERTFEEKEGYYVFTNKINYPNNKRLVKQIVYVDKKMNVKEVQVMDGNNNLQMKMLFDKIDYSPSFEKDEFELSENLETSTNTEEIKDVTKLEDVIYPMYLPTNTYLSGKETLTTENGERLILTFDGDNPFILVEETIKLSDEHTIVPVYGEPELLIDTVGSISDNSISWTSNGIEYYVISDVMQIDDLLQVARSVGTIPVAGSK